MELLRHVTLGQYVPGTSFVHRLDPRAKIGILAIAMVTAFSCVNLVPMGGLAVLCLASASLSGLRIGYYVSGLRSISLLALITLVFNAIFIRGGPPAFTIGHFEISQLGLHLSVLMTARLLLLFLMTSLFTLTTSPIRLTDALESVLSPLRIVGLRTAELSMMVSIALRFIPTLVETTDKIMKAQLSRGARFDEGHMLSRARAMLPVLVPLFVQAFHAADVLAEAMESRCYRGGAHRTRLVQLRATLADLGAVIGAGALCWGIFALDLWGHW